MKKIYIKPSVEAIKIISSYSLLTTSSLGLPIIEDEDPLPVIPEDAI